MSLERTCCRLGPNDAADIRRFAASRARPRLFSGADARDRILEHARSGLGQALADRLRKRCMDFTEPGHQNHLDVARFDLARLQGAWSYTDLGQRLADLAVGAWLWNEPRFANCARSLLMAMVRHQVGRNGSCVLVANACFRTTHALGFAGSLLAWHADFLGQWLTERDWEDITTWVRTYALDFGRDESFTDMLLKGPGHNMPATAACGLGLAALAVADRLEDQELSWALDNAVRTAFGYCRQGLDDDGGCLEGPGYGQHTLRRILWLAEALRRCGWPALSEYEPLRRYGWWICSILAPGGGTMPLGDSDGATGVIAELLLPAAWHRDGLLAWAHRKGLGRSDHPAGPYGDNIEYTGFICGLAGQVLWFDPSLAPKPPEQAGFPPHYHARGSDFVSLRTGWGEDDLAAVVSGCGRNSACSGHLGHEAGAISLMAYGRSLLHDYGYGYAGSDAHSTVRVADKPDLWVGDNALVGARICRFHAESFAALCAVDMSQMCDCRWAFRDVLLVRGQFPYLVVADDLNYRSDWAEYDWNWQHPPDADVRLPAHDGEPASILAGPAALDLISLTPAPDAYPKPYQTTWFAETYEPVSWAGWKGARFPRLRMRMAGYNGCLLTFLFPRRAGEPTPTVQRLDCLKPGIAASIRLGSVTDTVVFQPLSRILRTESICAAGRLALVRQSDDAITNHVLVDGYELEWNGRALVPPQQRAGNFIG